MERTFGYPFVQLLHFIYEEIKLYKPRDLKKGLLYSLVDMLNTTEDLSVLWIFLTLVFYTFAPLTIHSLTSLFIESKTAEVIVGERKQNTKSYSVLRI